MSDSHHKTELPATDVQLPSGSIWARLPLVFGVVGLAGVVLATLLRGDDTAAFYASYLVALVFFATIALGGLFFVLVHYATRAGWSVTVRRLAENTAFILPLIGVLFLPLLFQGVGEIYEWAHFEHALHEAEARHGGAEAGAEGEGAAAHGDEAVADDSHGDHETAAPEDGEEHAEGGHDWSTMTPDELREHDPVLAGKMPWLNTGFWRLRAVGYLVIWSLLGWYFRRRSVTQDKAGDKHTTRRLQGMSAPGLILFALTVTFASFDWIMSLYPHWFSTIFGVYIFAGCVIAIHAFLSVVGVSLQRSGLLREAITKEHYHDLGKMLFAFTVFWTYIAFSQYMLIWYANLPEETVFYEHRWFGGWQTVSILIGLGHFAVPFFFLMSRHIKRRPALLVAGATWMLIIHYIDLYWLVMPTFHADGPAFGLVDVLLIVGMGGLFMAAFSWNLKRDALVPVKDPRLPESLAFENF